MAHISGLAAFFIIVILLIVFGGAAWIVYTQLRARKLGLPPPNYNPFAGTSNGFGDSSASQGGPFGWINQKIRAFKNRNNRSAGGAYEEPLASNVRGRGANRGFGPLDPDDAWDARVGTEADAYGPGGYYEEQELGLHPGRTDALAPTPGAAPTGYGEELRGRSLSREPEPYIGGSHAGLDRRYDEEMGAKPVTNPFDDSHEASSITLRGVSPRPIEIGKSGHLKSQSKDSTEDSPTERHSVFRESL